MISRSSSNDSKYRTILAIGVAVIFYSNIPNYSFQILNLPFTPLDWIIVSVILSIVLFIRKPADVFRVFLSHRIMQWIIGYLLITSIWIVIIPQSDLLEARKRLLYMIFLCILIVILNGSIKLIRIVRWSLLCSVLFGVATNICELLYPTLFIPLGCEFADYGRSAGLYINANQSGAALVLGMLFSVGVLRNHKYRLIFLLVTLIGIFVTYSRAAILAWILTVVLLNKVGIISIRTFVSSVFIFALILLSATPLLLKLMYSKAEIDMPNVLQRVEWFLSFGRVVGESEDQRLYLMHRAWEMFLANPIVGNGVGATEIWSEGFSTHNMFLYLITDYGFIGIIILPLLFLSVTSGSKGESRKIAVVFFAVISFLALFSHNLLNEPYYLICFAVMAIMTSTSKQHTINSPSPVSWANTGSPNWLSRRNSIAATSSR